MTRERIRDYIIDRLIGRGGMASVYLATHVHLETKAALKILHEQYSDDPRFRARFLNEAKTLHKLHHPNIVEQKEFFEENTKLILVMEFIAGRGLDQVIGKEVGPIPYQKALPLFKQILEGIRYAHSMGVIHRDIKPENILLSSNDVVKISDFGIAKLADISGGTRTGAQLGTLRYMSPEQVKCSKTIDKRTDIYSLGITLYEMLSSRVPFHDDTDSSGYETMNSILNKELPDPRNYYPGIPEWLVSIVKKATAKSPADRYQTCEEFIEAIETGEKNASIKIKKLAKKPTPIAVSKSDPAKKPLTDNTKKIEQHTESITQQSKHPDYRNSPLAEKSPEIVTQYPSKSHRKKNKRWLWFLPVLIILPILIVGAILIFGGEKIECQYCDQKFSPDGIEAHIHAEHRFPCIYCDTVLHSEAELNYHITQEHTIECQYCLTEKVVSGVFHTQAELNSHLDSIHVFVCIHCNTILHSQLELDEHIASVYNFQCEYCEEVFFTQEEVDAHIASDHTYTCTVCCEVFPTNAEKQDHFAANHDRFVKSGNVITDYQTNQQWRVGPDSDTNWNEANSWVNGLGGSWRMPSLSELGALYNAGIKYGDWGHFQNSGAGIWSSQAEGSSSAWLFNFGHGYKYYVNRSNNIIGKRAFAVRSR